MVSKSIETINDLNTVLELNKGWANGKNIPIDHLYPTVAESRWEYENILGIYLTNPSYSWMALWMAVCNRNTLRKRNISYLRPVDSSDMIGGVELHSDRSITENLCEAAYLYFFDPQDYNQIEQVDITTVPKKQKADALLEQGFQWENMQRRGALKSALVDTTNISRLVLVDEWQLALTNTPIIVPKVELNIRKTAITELAGRIAITNTEIGEDYIR